MVGAELRVLLGEAGEPGFINIGPAVAVGVFHVGEPARERDEDAPLPRLQARDKQQLVGKRRGRFEAAIAIAVFQHANPRQRLAARRIAERIIAHLDDPHPAIFIEANRDRIDDVGLRRRQLDPQARIGKLHRLLGIGGRKRAGYVGSE